MAQLARGFSDRPGSRYGSTALCIGLGMAFTVTSKANIRVDILLDALLDKVRVACDLLASLSLTALRWMPLRIRVLRSRSITDRPG